MGVDDIVNICVGVPGGSLQSVNSWLFALSLFVSSQCRMNCNTKCNGLQVLCIYSLGLSRNNA